MESKRDKFSVKQRLRSFKYAFEGFKVLLKNEHNARVHLVVAGLVVILGFLFEIEALEWTVLVFAIGFVFVAEIFNTCVEEICNFICAENDVRIKKIKDLAAFAVLFSTINAVVVGFIIFLPKIF